MTSCRPDARTRNDATERTGIEPDEQTKAENSVGVLIDDGTLNTIASNVISGNLQAGVSITGSETTSNTITANLIGTNAPGDTAGATFGNGGDGILIDGGASSNTVDSNTLSGNFGNGVHISGQNTDRNTLSNDYIGTASDGGTLYSLGLGNCAVGVLIDAGASSNTVSSSVISANYANGAHVSGAGTSDNVVSHDMIGLDKAGDAGGVFGNLGDGILIDAGATSNTPKFLESLNRLGCFVDVLVGRIAITAPVANQAHNSTAPTAPCINRNAPNVLLWPHRVQLFPEAHNVRPRRIKGHS